MSETGVKTALICHSEERNVYNRIFGGYLMRQALEIAWIAVRRFACEYPVLVAMDDLVFKHPVEVGSMLFLSAYIVYHAPGTSHFVVRVNVEVLAIDSTTHAEQRLVANTAYILLAVPNSRIVFRDVYPESYGDAMMYIDGKRHYEDVINDPLRPSILDMLK
jgi:acyl-coenzyme A thioesterase 9